MAFMPIFCLFLFFFGAFAALVLCTHVKDIQCEKMCRTIPFAVFAAGFRLMSWCPKSMHWWMSIGHWKQTRVLLVRVDVVMDVTKGLLDRHPRYGHHKPDVASPNDHQKTSHSNTIQSQVESDAHDVKTPFKKCHPMRAVMLMSFILRRGDLEVEIDTTGKKEAALHWSITVYSTANVKFIVG
ncbi:hypothetical protein CAPTEDRAFT_206712 [Capitella teleta]|uniref:Frizzled/Smoothened transmembrane domain-containing protein n=1 Tax=Capitella teleta TaxID=283909 RepID=R7TVC8_CAPTE|nr:hypothetical protein CAPTEDRAFT_206712 [Capitella teleta]|eukprot:ELT97679.1 hypothetical protein CAPTEDRAFT_206712 [Capitella teleta]